MAKRSPIAIMSMLLLIIGGVAAVVMMLHICADVISREFRNQPIAGTLEFVQYYYMVSVVFLPLAITQYNRTLVVVELFLQKLDPRSILRVDGVSNIYTAVYVGFLAIMSLNEAIKSTNQGEMLPLYSFDLITWPTRWLLPIGLFGMLIVLLAQVPGLLAARKELLESKTPSAH